MLLYTPNPKCCRVEQRGYLHRSLHVYLTWRRLSFIEFKERRLAKWDRACVFFFFLRQPWFVCVRCVLWRSPLGSLAAETTEHSPPLFERTLQRDVDIFAAILTAPSVTSSDRYVKSIFYLFGRENGSTVARVRLCIHPSTSVRCCVSDRDAFQREGAGLSEPPALREGSWAGHARTQERRR